MQSIPYNRKAAVSYAAQYALQYNPMFGSWAQSGGDCANFVSQCLLAGGLPMKRSGKRQWYYNTPGGRYTGASSSWKGAQSLKLFLKNNREPPYIPVDFLPTAQGLQQGDLLWALNHDNTKNKPGRTAHHVVLVDHVSTNGEIFIYGHTADKRNGRWVYAPDDTLYGRLADSIVLSGTDEPKPSLEDHEQTVSSSSNSRLLQYRSNTRLQSGHDVRSVQIKLQELGFSPGPIDGLFGPLTSAAIKVFQAARGLQVDGIVGPLTMNALQK